MENNLDLSAIFQKLTQGNIECFKILVVICNAVQDMNVLLATVPVLEAGGIVGDKFVSIYEEECAGDPKRFMEYIRAETQAYYTIEALKAYI